MLPEIQATLARPPATLQTMMRGVGLSYVVVILAYYGVAISGYAAFGAGVSSGELNIRGGPRAALAAPAAPAGEGGRLPKLASPLLVLPSRRYRAQPSRPQPHRAPLAPRHKARRGLPRPLRFVQMCCSTSRSRQG